MPTDSAVIMEVGGKVLHCDKSSFYDNLWYIFICFIASSYVSTVGGKVWLHDKLTRYA